MTWLRWFKRGARNDDAALLEWRKRWMAATESPTGTEAATLRAQLEAIGLDSDNHEIEREMLEGLEALVELIETDAHSGLVAIPTGHRAVGSDQCYFSAPASLPDDPAQPSGTLLLTNVRAIFVGGARAVTIPWHSVGACMRQERDVLLVRVDRQDVYRVRCNTFGEALHAAYLVRHFTSRRRV